MVILLSNFLMGTESQIEKNPNKSIYMKSFLIRISIKNIENLLIYVCVTPRKSHKRSRHTTIIEVREPQGK